MDERTEELAVAYALDALDPAAAREFEAELARDFELRAFADSLRETAAALVQAVPARLPSPELRERVVSAVRMRAAAQTSAVAMTSSRNWLPWALAAGLLVTTAAMWFERDQWRRESLALREEALELRGRDSLAKLRIATLSAQVETFAKSSAVVVWDAEQQRGIVRLEHLPPVERGRDYQLWVIDPKYPQPVSGGIVPVDPQGYARVAFTAGQPIKKAENFAISIEPAGGAPSASGPIILIGK